MRLVICLSLVTFLAACGDDKPPTQKPSFVQEKKIEPKAELSIPEVPTARAFGKMYQVSKVTADRQGRQLIFTFSTTEPTTDMNGNDIYPSVIFFINLKEDEPQLRAENVRSVGIIFDRFSTMRRLTCQDENTRKALRSLSGTLAPGGSVSFEYAYSDDTLTSTSTSFLAKVTTAFQDG